ncbi:MAG: hypothetical protein CMQ22_01165 [Gammaproteobacteria bacterium]|nr:hypothetical protein [Gammaproteobacteria bacterium]
MVETLHFIRPYWFLALLPILALAWFWFRRTRSGSAWHSAISKELLPVLLDIEETRSGQWLRSLMLAALTLAVVGLAGPTWEKLPQNVEQKNDALVVLLDLSLSMWAEDIKPSRIVRARQKITDILRQREEGMTALVAYAGDAHAVVPLTDDVATIENLLGALDPGMMPVLGSNPSHGLEIAKELFSNANMTEGRILMITDGIDKISAVSGHRNRAFPISIIGIGTYDGGTIPLDSNAESRRYLMTQEGNQVIALLDERRLADVANLSYGKYSKLSLSDADFKVALSTPLPTEDSSIEVEREFDTWFDQGHWLAVFLLPLCLLGFRRGALVMLAFAFTVPSFDAVAETTANRQTTPGTLWDKLWWRDDQRAHQALTAGEPEKAAILFEDPQWRAVARYRTGDWTDALRGFNQDSTTTGAYNRANTQARLGNYQQALDLYAQVLSAAADHEDAAFNKALVERLLQQQQQQQAEAQQDSTENQQDQPSNESEQSQSEDQQQQSDQQSNESPSQPNEDQRQSEQERDGKDEDQQRQEMVNRDEKQEALEQWLRRVPDEPGGLLRRKFQHETKQRLRNGDYEHRQGDKIW